MAPLPEAGPGTPNSADRTPRASPNPSPRYGPQLSGERPPAFGLNVAGEHGLAMRPKSTAPYPDDEQPPPLHVGRPHSAVPYPDEGPRPPPHQQRIHSGLPPPHAARPGSAGGRMGPGPHVGPGGPIPPAGTMPGQGRGRIASGPNQPYPSGSAPASPYPPGSRNGMHTARRHVNEKQANRDRLPVQCGTRGTAPADPRPLRPHAPGRRRTGRRSLWRHDVAPRRALRERPRPTARLPHRCRTPRPWRSAPRRPGRRA